MAVYTKKSMLELIDKTRNIVLDKGYIIEEYKPRREYSFEIILVKAESNYILICILVMKLNYRYSLQSNFEDIDNFRLDFIKEKGIDPEKVGVIVTSANTTQMNTLTRLATKYAFGLIPLDVTMQPVEFKQELSFNRDDDGSLVEYLESIGTAWDIQTFIKKLIYEHMEQGNQIKDISSKVDKILKRINREFGE